MYSYNPNSCFLGKDMFFVPVSMFFDVLKLYSLGEGVLGVPWFQDNLHTHASLEGEDTFYIFRSLSTRSVCMSDGQGF